MHFLRYRKTDSLLGIDITATHIYLAELAYVRNKYQLQQIADSPRVVSSSTLKIWDNPTLIAELKQILSIAKFNRDAAAVAFRHNAVLCKNLELDARLKRVEILQYLTAHSQRLFNLPAAALVIDFTILPESTQSAGKTQTVRCVAARRSEVNRCQEVLEKTGLNLTLIDLDSEALRRIALAYFSPNVNENVALIHCHFEDYLLIVFNQRSLLYSHQEGIEADGVAQWQQMVGQAALRNFTIQGFGQSVGSIDRIFLTGPLATENFSVYLQSQIGMPVQILNPFLCCEPASQFSESAIATQFALSLGLAMRVKQ